MFGFIFVSFMVLFFVLILIARTDKTRLRVAKGFLIILLGSLAVAGAGAIFAGIFETLRGEMAQKQLLIQIGAGLLFIGAGGVPLYIFFVSREIAIRKLKRRQKQYPDAPWMWVEEWANKTMVCSNKGPVAFAWFVLSGLSAGLTFVSYSNREVILSKLANRDLEVIAFCVVLVVILFLPFYAAVALLRGHLKFGESTFEMSTHPGIIGGQLAGTIHPGMKEIPPQGFKLELQCSLLDVSPRTGGRLSRTDKPATLWGAEKTINLEAKLGPHGVSIPVSFSIPADARESDAWSPDIRVEWTLSASSSLGRTAYFSRFVVPVFRTR